MVYSVARICIKGQQGTLLFSPAANLSTSMQLGSPRGWRTGLFAAFAGLSPLNEIDPIRSGVWLAVGGV